MNERDKVRHIARRLDDELTGDLYLGSESRSVGRVHVMRRGFGTEYGRPDVVLMIELDLEVLGANVKVRTPVLVEAEDAGLNAAHDDWELYFERDRLKIPMVVVGKAGARREYTTWTADARVTGEIQFVGMDEG